MGLIGFHNGEAVGEIGLMSDFGKGGYDGRVAALRVS